MITEKQLVEEYKKTIGKYTYAQRDCIGSIWKILERYGAKTDNVGSNWFARHELKNMRPLISRDQLYNGCAVLKTKLKGESGYALPDRYLSDADLIDYNHIGIGTDSGEIYDSTRYTDSKGEYIRNGPGLSTARIGPDSWDIIGDFEDVDYTGGDNMADIDPVPNGEPNQNDNPEPAYINLPVTETVKHRISPNKNSAWWGVIRGGTIVEVYGGEPGWARVLYGGHDGYVMEQFVSKTLPEQPDIVPDIVPDVDRQALLNELKGIIDRANAIIRLL